jgi:RimJ/RimL family protein N-acetyltransferase
MQLRPLQMKDAPLMLEWMHDADVTAGLQGGYDEKTLGDAEEFIAASHNDTENLHLAIASDEDEYMGTVSLKHINRERSDAEFAITVRKAAMGRGYSSFGMNAIIEKGLGELGLSCVYWCVSRKNTRAVRFYDKHDFPEMQEVPQEALDAYAALDDLKWYAVYRDDSGYKQKQAVAGCPVHTIKTIPTDGAGTLSFLEAERDFPFPVKRIYYIAGVPEGVRRGFHAHKELKQLIFCPYGRIRLLIDDGTVREEIELSDPSVGIVIDKPVWREMLWLQKDSVLCVAASDYYTEDDYIRDYEQFKTYLGGMGK